MTYCGLHQRVLFPSAKRKLAIMASHWHQMKTEVFHIGFAVALAFPGVKLVEMPCDKCVAERGEELFR